MDADGITGVTRVAATLSLPKPYLLFLGDSTQTNYAKTAFGLRDWAAEACVAEYALPGCTVTTRLPGMTPQQAHAAGARALVIGVANVGGQLAQSWLPALVEALAAGLDIVSGMHTPLAAVPALREAASRHARRLHNVRVPPPNIPIATGRKRSGRRLRPTRCGRVPISIGWWRLAWGNDENP